MARSPARLLVVLAASASACAWLQMAEGGFQKPTVAYKSASLSDVTLSGATLNLVLTVDNPNPVELALADVDYRLAIDGHQVATGRPPEGLQIPAKGPGTSRCPPRSSSRTWVRRRQRSWRRAAPATRRRARSG